MHLGSLEQGVLQMQRVRFRLMESNALGDQCPLPIAQRLLLSTNRFELRTEVGHDAGPITGYSEQRLEQRRTIQPA